MKTFLFVFVNFVVYAKVSALRCYICDSHLHGSSCYDPINTSNVKALDCKEIYGFQRNVQGSAENETSVIEQPEKIQNWNPAWDLNINPNPTQFECVQYDRIHTRTNRREFVRRCQGKNQSPNFCGQLQEIGNFQGYRLNKCDVCSTDYCNKSVVTKLSLFLNFVFFLLFYRCTDFSS